MDRKWIRWVVCNERFWLKVFMALWQGCHAAFVRRAHLSVPFHFKHTLPPQCFSWRPLVSAQHTSHLWSASRVSRRQCAPPETSERDVSGCYYYIPANIMQAWVQSEHIYCLQTWCFVSTQYKSAEMTEKKVTVSLYCVHIQPVLYCVHIQGCWQAAFTAQLL